MSWTNKNGVKRMNRDKTYVIWGKTIRTKNPNTKGIYAQYDWIKNTLVIGRKRKGVRFNVYRIPNPYGYYEVNTEKDLARLALIPLELVLEDAIEFQKLKKPFNPNWIYPERIRFTRYASDLVNREKSYIKSTFFHKSLDIGELLEIWVNIKFLTGDPMHWAETVFCLDDYTVIPVCVNYLEDYKKYLYRLLIERDDGNRTLVFSWWDKVPDINPFQMSEQEIIQVLMYVLNRKRWVRNENDKMLLQDLHEKNIDKGCFVKINAAKVIE